MPKLESEFTKKVSVMFRPDQYHDLKEMARRCGMSVGSLIRHLFDAVNDLQKKKEETKKSLDFKVYPK